MQADVNSIVATFERAQNSLVLQSSDLSLETIAKMVDGNAIDTEPRFQRRQRWPVEAQSALIESFLLNVPVPPVYLAEDDFGTYSVIDGKQRITAIADFLRGFYVLKGLQRFIALEGLSFIQLPIPLRNALSIRPYVRAVTLLKQSDPDLKYEVFTRLNTGGRPLLPQEIRNALYRGALNNMIFGVSEHPFLRKQLKIKTGNESAYAEMVDVEMILRFLTMRSEWSNFSGDYRRSMDAFMQRHQRLGDAAIRELASDAASALERCEAMWGDSAFRRYENGTFRDQFMAALYDAQMIAADSVGNSDYRELVGKRREILERTRELFHDKAFEQSIRISTNTATRVKYRIQKVKDMLTALL